MSAPADFPTLMQRFDALLAERALLARCLTLHNSLPVKPCEPLAYCCSGCGERLGQHAPKCIVPPALAIVRRLRASGWIDQEDSSQP